MEIVTDEKRTWDEQHPAPIQPPGAERPTFRYLVWKKRKQTHHKLVHLRNDFTQGVRKAYDGSKKAAKTAGTKVAATARGTAYGVAWIITGLANVLATVAYKAARAVVVVATYLLAYLLLGFVYLLTLLLWVIGSVLFAIVKVVQLAAMVVATPWILLHSKDALKTDWETFWYSCHPRNIHILFPEFFGFDKVEARAKNRKHWEEATDYAMAAEASAYTSPVPTPKDVQPDMRSQTAAEKDGAMPPGNTPKPSVGAGKHEDSSARSRQHPRTSRGTGSPGPATA